MPGQQPDDRTNSNKEIGFSLSYPFLYLVLLVYYLLSSYLPN
ncbi:putative membrane protein [Bacteroides fragilis str. 1007-1-F |uniref:Membrane protein n=1 Tax=Bacteroides fragilis str. 1007-1-F \|nr:putative membrane protein [Bacteroides fragilis str. 1007-1-F \